MERDERSPNNKKKGESEGPRPEAKQRLQNAHDSPMPIILPPVIITSPFGIPSYPLQRLAQNKIKSLAHLCTCQAGLEWSLNTRLFFSRQISQHTAPKTNLHNLFLVFNLLVFLLFCHYHPRIPITNHS